MKKTAMLTAADVAAIQDKACESVGALRAELADLVKRQRVIEQELDDTVDLDRVQALREEREEVKDRMRVARARMAKAAFDVRSEVQTRFAGYAESVNEQLRAKLDAYRSAREALFHQFMELCEIQNEACKIAAACKRTFADRAQWDIEDRSVDLAKLEIGPKDGKPIRVGAGLLKGPADIAFFTGLGFLRSEQAAKLAWLLNNGEPRETLEAEKDEFLRTYFPG